MAALLLPKVNMNIRVYAWLTAARERQPREEKVGVVPFAYSSPLQGKSSSISFTDLELVVPYSPAGVPLMSLAASFLLQVLELCSSGRKMSRR